MRRWRFNVVMNVGNGNVKADTIEVVANDSYHAVAALPDNTISWDFAQYPDGQYSQPMLVAAV